MGNKEVIDYVMDSPGNTNRAVLKGLLENTGGGEPGGDVFMVEVGPQEDDPAIIEFKATWQEIYDAFTSGKLVIAHSYSADPSGSGGYMYTNNIVDLVCYYPNESDPYIAQSGGGLGACHCKTPDERPNNSSA